MRWLFLALALLASPAAAQQPLEVAIVTGVDMSYSVKQDELALQAEGLARGVTSEQFLSALPEGGAGFEVFAWAAGGEFRTIVPRRIIRNAEDAQEVAALLRTLPETGRTPYTATDIAGAMGEAMRRGLLHRPERLVINIVTDGTDNNGEKPNKPQAAVEALGITINAIIFGEAMSQEAYFRANVVAGLGAFVWPVAAPEDMPETLAKKFYQDLVSSLQGAQ